MLASGLVLVLMLANGGQACMGDPGCAMAPAVEAGSQGEPAIPSEVLAVLRDLVPPDSREDGPLPDDSTEGEAIIVSGEIGPPEGDPAERLNAQTFETVQAVDDAVVRPLAHAYDEGLPKPLRDGVGNFISNLGEPINVLNSLLQLKPGMAIKALGRFAINSTLGIGGLFDHASKDPFNIPHERNGFANTLGYYGVDSGPYLYLPLIGSTTVRDLVGRLADLSVLPTAVGKPFNNPYYALPLGSLNALEDRLDTDAQIEAIRERCGDPYAATRDIYLLQREADISALRGREAKALGKIAERLAFNCDIEVITAGEEPVRDRNFVTGRTTLLNGRSATPANEAAESTAGAQGEQPVEEPAIRQEDRAQGDTTDGPEQAVQ